MPRKYRGTLISKTDKEKQFMTSDAAYKSDLNKDGELSSYEKKRGMAINKAMSDDRVNAKDGGCMQIKGWGKARRR